MTERMKFVALVEEGDETIAALCRRFGISRKTGYKLLARYAAEGVDGLCDRSHAAHHHPHAVSEIIESRIVALRSEHPSWGPRKLACAIAHDRTGDALARREYDGRHSSPTRPGGTAATPVDGASQYVAVCRL